MESIGIFRLELMQVLETRYERPRRILFAQCDLTNPDNKQFLLDEENVSYPNIVMLVRDVVISFDQL